MAASELRLGPLTTKFTAPAACNSITVEAGALSNIPWVYPREFASVAASCFPSGYPLGSVYNSVSSVYGEQDYHVYYSPGICPSGWQSNTIASTGDEKTAFCCEPGFNPRTLPAVTGGGVSTLCSSNIESTVVTTVAYAGFGTVDGPTQTFTFVGNEIRAPAIWIRYKDSDFPTDPTATASATPSTTQSPSITPSPSTIPSPSITQSPVNTSKSTTNPGSVPSSTENSGSSPTTSKLISISTENPGSSPTTTDNLSKSAVPSGNSASSSSLARTASSSLPIIPSLSLPGTSSSTPLPTLTPSYGLSSGAKIGLGVGISFAVILAGAIVAFFLLRRRKQRKLSNTREIAMLENREQKEGEGLTSKSELPVGSVSRKTVAGRAELSADAIHRHELEGDGASTIQRKPVQDQEYPGPSVVLVEDYPRGNSRLTFLN